MKQIFTYILLFVGLGQAQAQEILPQQEAKYITSFPFFHFSGGVVVLKAKFEDVPDSLNFILDTGSGGISLDSSTCKEFDIPIRATDTIITGIGGIRKVAFAFDKTLHLPGLDVKHLNFHVNNYDILTSVYGQKIDGIIGYSFFSRYIVQIDYDSNRIHVYSPGKFDYPRGGHLLHPAFTNLPIQWMRLKDKNSLGFNFYIDTGAGICFLMSEKFAKDSGILLPKRKPVITQAEGMGGKTQMRLTIIKEVKLGPFKFRDVPTYLYKDDYNVTSYPFTGGLIGNDLLRRFNVVFNYPHREIHLLPNNHFNEDFDYAYSGLSIYYIDGKIVVDDVIKGSPADIAKFKINDELVVVDRNVSNNIQTYKNILQRPNQNIKIIVRRENSLVELNLFTISIR